MSLCLGAAWLAGCSSSRPQLDGIEQGVLTFGGAAAPGSLVVTLDGYEPDVGQLLLALFRSPRGFPNDQTQAAATATAAPSGPSVAVVFPDVPPGPFAVAVFHDVNGNFELDTNFIGIPSEPWGVSKDAAGWLGPPKYASAQLTLHPGESLEITVLLGN